MNQIAHHFHEAWATFGLAGFVGFWAVKMGLTLVLFRQFQRKFGHRGPFTMSWLNRCILRRRDENGTNGR